MTSLVSTTSPTAVRASTALVLFFHLDIPSQYNTLRNIQFDANNRFFYVDAENKLKVIEAEAASTASSVSGKLAVVGNKPERRSLQKRTVSFNGCTSSRQTSITTAAGNAVTYASNAASYLAGISAATTRYTTWFGAYTSTRKNTVHTHYVNIGTDPTSSTYDCTCTDTDTYAYVYPDTPGESFGDACYLYEFNVDL